MRKLILQMQTSVDGFVASTRGDGGNWLVWDWGDNCTWDDDLKQDFNAVFSTVDCILLSRKMLDEGYLDHWTKASKKFAGEPQYAFARKIVDVDKVVVSNQLDGTDYPRTKIVKGDITEHVSALKRERGKDIICFGGASLAASLISAGLVDEYQFFVNPTAIGEGRSLFAGRPANVTLELKRSRAYPCGVVVNRYAPAPVRLSRSFHVSAEAIFDAWVKPDLMRQWMFAAESNEIIEAHNDPKPGGSFSVKARSPNGHEGHDGQIIDHFGEYVEVERPQRLVFTLQVPKHFPGVTRVGVHIERTAKGSVLTFTQTGVDKQVTEGAWRDMLETLARITDTAGRR